MTPVILYSDASSVERHMKMVGHKIGTPFAYTYVSLVGRENGLDLQLYFVDHLKIPP